MPISNDSINKKLYDLLKVQGFDPVPKNSKGDTTPVPNDADVFRFTFKVDGKPVGPAWVTVDSNQDLKVYYDDETMGAISEDGGQNHLDDFTEFLQQLKQWAQRKQLGFDIENQDHLESDMAQREYVKKQEQINEGYYPMGKTSSYNDSVPTVKIVLQHTRAIQEGEQRFRNIAKIFLENTEGERILAPTTRPGVAKVYARHLAEGGLPHDERWNHINNLVEEYTKMAGFVRATRGNQFNESAQQLVNEGLNHYQSLRETLSKMTGHRGYNTYFDSWTPTLMETEGEETNLNELFVQETLDPRIESVMPILSRLHKKVNEMGEVKALEEWADQLINEKMVMGSSSDASSAGSYKMGEATDPLSIPENENNPVVNAVTRRILMQRTDLLQKYGPEKVGQAIDNVADFVGRVDEIGSSDVSGWVKQVEKQLADENLEEGLGTKVLAGAALLGALLGINQYQANEVYKNSPQLQTLLKLHQDAKASGDVQRVKELETRIRLQKDRLSLDKGEVVGKDGLPIQVKEGVVEGWRQDQYKQRGINSIMDLVKPAMQEKKSVDGWISSIYNYIEDHDMKNDPRWLKAKSDAEKMHTAWFVKNNMPTANTNPPLARQGDVMKYKALIQNLAKEFGEQGVAEGSEYTPPKLGTVKASIMNTTTPTVQIQVFKHNTLRGDSYWVTKQVKTFKTMDQAKAYVDRINKQGVAEDLDANQKRVGQLGPTEKVGPKGAVGKLVGANESKLNEMDSEGYKGHRGDEDSGKGPEKKATPAKTKDVAKDAEKELDKAMDKAHKKEVKEGQEDLDAILRIIKK